MKAAAVIMLVMLVATAAMSRLSSSPSTTPPAPLVYRVDDVSSHGASVWFFRYYPWNSTIITDRGERFNGSAIHIGSIGVDLPLCIDTESYNRSVDEEPVEIVLSRGDRMERIRALYMLWFLGESYAADAYYYPSNGVLIEAHIDSKETPYTVDIVIENTSALASVQHASACVEIHGLGENTTSTDQGETRGGGEPAFPLYQLLVIASFTVALTLFAVVRRRTVAK